MDGVWGDFLVQPHNTTSAAAIAWFDLLEAAICQKVITQTSYLLPKISVSMFEIEYYYHV